MSKFFVVVNRDGKVDSVELFDEQEAQELAFTKQCTDRGVEPDDGTFMDGFMELEEGTTICMGITDTKNPTQENDIKEVWDTFHAGGPFAHNMISLKLGMIEKAHGKMVARAVYADLIEEGY